MHNFSFDLVGFDLDGTLFDTSRDLAAALNQTLALANRPPFSVAQIKPMIGRGIHHMLGEGLRASGGDEDLDALFPHLLDFYEKDIACETTLYPGALACLDQLEQTGVSIAIVTNKLERLATRIVEQLGLSERFACIIGGDTTSARKPSPIPIQEMLRRCGSSKAAFVGDSIFDIEAARAAGLPSIAVRFGFLSQPVESLGADAIIDHFDALIPTLKIVSQ